MIHSLRTLHHATSKKNNFLKKLKTSHNTRLKKSFKGKAFWRTFSITPNIFLVPKMFACEILGQTYFLILFCFIVVNHRKGTGGFMDGYSLKEWINQMTCKGMVTVFLEGTFSPLRKYSNHLQKIWEEGRGAWSSSLLYQASPSFKKARPLPWNSCCYYLFLLAFSFRRGGGTSSVCCRG